MQSHEFGKRFYLFLCISTNRENVGHTRSVRKTSIFAPGDIKYHFFVFLRRTSTKLQVYSHVTAHEPRPGQVTRELLHCSTSSGQACERCAELRITRGARCAKRTMDALNNFITPGNRSISLRLSNFAEALTTSDLTDYSFPPLKKRNVSITSLSAVLVLLLVHNFLLYFCSFFSFTGRLIF